MSIQQFRLTCGRGSKRFSFSSAEDQRLQEIAESARQQIAAFLKNTAAGCTAVLIDGELTALEEGDTSSALFAAAVDLGINTLVMSLVDLSHGQEHCRGVRYKPAASYRS